MLLSYAQIRDCYHSGPCGNKSPEARKTLNPKLRKKQDSEGDSETPEASLSLATWLGTQLTIEAETNTNTIAGSLSIILV